MAVRYETKLARPARRPLVQAGGIRHHNEYSTLGTKAMNRKPYSHFLVVLFLMGVLFSAVRVSDSDYQEAVKALGAKDYATALRYLGSALGGDPVNVRYASDNWKTVIGS